MSLGNWNASAIPKVNIGNPINFTNRLIVIWLYLDLTALVLIAIIFFFFFISIPTTTTAIEITIREGIQSNEVIGSPQGVD